MIKWLHRWRFRRYLQTWTLLGEYHYLPFGIGPGVVVEHYEGFKKARVAQRKFVNNWPCGQTWLYEGRLTVEDFIAQGKVRRRKSDD